MKQYLSLLENILENGDASDDRTGVGTIATFGEMIKFDLRDGFPAVTTKKLAWKSVVSELLWFLKGSDNLYDLRALLHGEEHRFNDEKRTIWDDNYNHQGFDLGYNNGYMGAVYGRQWRCYGKHTQEFYDSELGYESYDYDGFDQVKWLIDEAKANPNSRRLLVTAWNPLDLNHEKDEFYESDKPVLPPCHYGYQINIVGDYIDLKWEQRSVDSLLGLPFNIASYGLLLCIFGRILGKTPRYLVGSLGNAHIYNNHIEQVKLQLTRTPMALPTIDISDHLETLEDFENAKVDDFKLIDYKHHETIKAVMAV